MASDNNASNKRRRTGTQQPPNDASSWTFRDMLMECGVQKLDKAEPCSLDANSSSSSLRNSLHALLEELTAAATKQDQGGEEFADKIRSDLEEIMEDASLLFRMLSPLHLTCTTPAAQEQQQRSTTCILQDTSLIKVLTRVEAIQTPLLVLLLQKLPELATDDYDFGVTEMLLEDTDTDTAKQQVDVIVTIDISQLPRLIVSHIRWIDGHIVSPEALTETALQCLTVLSSSGTTDNPVTRAIQLDLISLLPDIVGYNQVGLIENVVEALQECRGDDPTLLVPCLDALSSLPLTAEQLEGTVRDALAALESVPRLELPAIIRYLVHHVPTSAAAGGDLCKEVICEIRKMELGEKGNEDDSVYDGNESGRKRMMDESRNAEALTLEALSQGMQYRSDFTDSLLSAIQKSSFFEHGPSDIWLMMCCAYASHNRSKVRSLFRQKAASGAFNVEIVKIAIVDNGAALSFLFHSSVIDLCDILVRSSEKLARELGGVMYNLLFAEYTDPIQRQEIIGALVTHIGSGYLPETDIAMEVLAKLTRDTISATGGGESLRPFIPFFTSLLDFIQQLTPSQVRKLFIILFAVGDDGTMDNSASAGGYDDVHIVIRKHLSQRAISMKQIGIIGAVSFVVSRSAKYARMINCDASQPMRLPDNPENDEDGACSNELSPTSLYMQDIMNMLRLAHRSCEPRNAGAYFACRNNALSHGSALAFFFDELSYAVRGGQLIADVKAWILSTFSPILEEGSMGEFSDPAAVEENNMDAIVDGDDRAIVSGTSANVRAVQGSMRFNIDRGEAAIYVKLLPLAASNAIAKQAMPQYICSLLHLLSSCHDDRFGGEGVLEIDAVLGCPLLLPAQEHLGIEFVDMLPAKQLTAVAALFSATCWCRELINSFVVSAAGSSEHSEEMRSKIIERLKNLIQLEEELTFASKKCYQFAPPNMSVYPPPKEVIETKPISLTDVSSENICNKADVNTKKNAASAKPNLSKEEKKTLMEARKMATKQQATHEKNKLKLIKVRRRYEEELAQRCHSALRPLSMDTALALGFPELGVMGCQHENGSQILSVGASQLKDIDIGGPVICLLFRQLVSGLCSIFSVHPQGLKNWNTSNSIGTSALKNCTDQNPYQSNARLNGQGNQLCNNRFDILQMYLDGNIFITVYEHLAAFAEIGAAEESLEKELENGTRRNHRNCLGLLFDCVRTIMNACELTSNSNGREIYRSLMRQLAEGESDCTKTVGVDIPMLIKSTSDVFDLVEEIVRGGDMGDDLSFAMEGISCLESIISCAARLGLITKGSIIQDAPDVNQGATNIVPTLRKKISSLCHILLQRRWGDGIKFSKKNVGKLLALYVDYSFVPFTFSRSKLVNEMGHMNALVHLSRDVISELPHYPRCKGPVETFPTLTLQSFSCYFTIVLEGVSREVNILFDSMSGPNGPKQVQAAFDVISLLVDIMGQCFDLTKDNPPLVKSAFLLTQLKSGTTFLRAFISKVIPYMQIQFEDGNEQRIIHIIKNLQKSTRIMNNIIAHGRRVKDPNLIKESPKAKKQLETFIHKIKVMMKKNNCLSAMWGGNLKTKNIDGSLYVEEEKNDDDKTNGSVSDDDDTSTDVGEDDTVVSVN